MNSFWEEALWRGVYITLFPDNRWWSMVWPTVWFALWHYAPGSISPLADVRTLMMGAGVLGGELQLVSAEDSVHSYHGVDAYRGRSGAGAVLRVNHLSE